MSPEPRESDAELWRAVVGGHAAESLAVVLDRHQERIHRHALGLVPARDDAKDVVAITFLEAWRRRAEVRFVDGSLLPWLLVTATHTARNITRSARRYRDLIERVPLSLEAPDPAGALEEGRAVAALKTLSEAHRTVVTLCVIEGLPVADAALVLDVPVGTVKSRLHFAKRALSERLVPEEPTPTGALRLVRGARGVALAARHAADRGGGAAIAS